MLGNWLEGFSDFSNIWFAFCGHIFIKVPLLLWPVEHITSFAAFFLINAYISFVLLQAKEETISRILKAFDRQVENKKELREEVEETAQQYLQWGDLGELAFGKVKGRAVIEFSLFIALLLESIAACCCILDALSIPHFNYPNSIDELVVGVNETNSTTIKRSLVDGGLPVMAIIFVIIFILATLLPGYRYTGVTSFAGLVCVFLSIFMGFYPNPEFTDDDTEIIDGNIKIRFMKMYGAPQVAVVIFAIHGSLTKAGRRNFTTGLLFSYLFCIFDVVFIGIGWLFLNFQNQIFHLSLLELWPLKLPLLICYTSFFFLLNFPIYQLLDRWLTRLKRTYRSSTLARSLNGMEAIELLFEPRPRKSIFEALRLEKIRCELKGEVIIGELSRKITSWKKYVVRITIVIVEVLLAVLHYKCHVSQLIHSYLEWITSVWIGIIMPICIFLKLMDKASVLNKAVSVFIIILSIAWILFIYSLPFWDSGDLGYLLKTK